MVKELVIKSIEKVELLGSRAIITHTNEPGFRRTLEVSRDMPIGEVLEELYFSYSQFHNCGEVLNRELEKEVKQFQKENRYLRESLNEMDLYQKAKEVEYERNLQTVRKGIEQDVLERISRGLRQSMNIVSRSSGKSE